MLSSCSSGVSTIVRLPSGGFLTDFGQVFYRAGAYAVLDLFDGRLVLAGQLVLQIAERRQADAVLIQPEQIVLRLDAAVDDLADRHVDVDVKSYERGRHDGVGSHVGRVEGRAYHQSMFLLGRLQGAEYVLVADARYDVGSAVYHAGRDFLGLGDVGERAHVCRKHLYVGVDALAAAFEPFVVLLDGGYRDGGNVGDLARLAHQGGHGA